MRSFTAAQVAELRTLALDTEAALCMDDETFRGFYEGTARAVWSYLARITGDAALADDLLQETYYRFLRADRAFDTNAHRRNYLYRIATNLAHDDRRRRHVANLVPVPGEDAPGVLRAGGGDVAESAARRTDVARAMARLRPRERSLVWLAYAQGSSHSEIAAALGVKTASVKSMLFRARTRLAKLLGGSGHDTR